jgi:hypothetical protein
MRDTDQSMNGDIHLEHRASSSQASTNENPRFADATGSTGLAIKVRDSSRRIMIMRFRPANISLINRRSRLLRCCSLCLRLFWYSKDLVGKGNSQCREPTLAEPWWERD